jgi:hypothetical protein
MAQLPRCNENCIKQLMYFQVPCVSIVDYLTDVVHWTLDSGFLGGPIHLPPWAQDPPAPWLPGSKNASGGWGTVASRSPGPKLASGGWDPVALSIPAWCSRARDASESEDPAATPTLGLLAGSGSWDPEPFAGASFGS